MMDKVTEAIINKLPRLISQRPLEWARAKPDHPAIVEDKVSWTIQAPSSLHANKMVVHLSPCCSREVNWVPVSSVSTPVSRLLKSITFRSIVNRVVRFTR